MVKRKIDSILNQPKPIPENSRTGDLSQKYDLSEQSARKIAQMLNEPKTDILNDLPTYEDAFGFKILVRTISNIAIAQSTRTPLTICVDGEWGSGKTSFLKMVEAQAKILGLNCIWLNAWKLDNAEQFFLAIADAMLREFNLYTEEITSNNQRISRSREVTSKTESRRHVWKWTETPFQIRFSDVIKRLQDNEKERQEVTKATSTPHSKRLIVFIDDIDRAFPDQIAMVLKNLKLLLESAGCIFIMAMDVNIVAKSLESIYVTKSQTPEVMVTNIGESRDNTSITINNSAQQFQQQGLRMAREFGYSYLDKLIQLHVKIPQLTRDVIYNYLEDLGVLESIIEIVSHAPDEEILNPRSLKRYINWLSMSLQLINASSLPTKISNLDALRFIVLRHDYPSIYSSLVLASRPNFWEVLEEQEVEKSLLRYIRNLPLDDLFEFDTYLSKAPVLASARINASM